MSTTTNVFFFFFDVKGSSQENVTPRNPDNDHTTFDKFHLWIVKNSRQLFAIIFRFRQKNQTESDLN